MRKCVSHFAVLLTVATKAWCGLTVTAENPGVQTTSVPGAVAYTFDSPSAGYLGNVFANFGSVTGIYDTLYIQEPDIYGGAYATTYLMAFYFTGLHQNDFHTSSYSLRLSSPVNYFGSYWLAGNPYGQFDFYLGETLVGTFSSASALKVLPSTYLGNPNGGSDPGEPFAYLNFFGTGRTTFDRIVLTVTSNTAVFRTDNHAIAVNATPAGGLLISDNVTPAPVAGAPVLSVAAEIALVLLLAAGGGLLLRKSQRHPEPRL